MELTYYHDTLSNPEIQHFDSETGVILKIDKYSMPLDTVKKDLRAEVVGMNKSLKEKEKEYKEKHGEQDGVVEIIQN